MHVLDLERRMSLDFAETTDAMRSNTRCECCCRRALRWVREPLEECTEPRLSQNCWQVQVDDAPRVCLMECGSPIRGVRLL